MNIITNKDAIKILEYGLSRMVKTYIDDGKPFLAAAMFGIEARALLGLGLDASLCGEPDGKKCGKVNIKPCVMYKNNGQDSNGGQRITSYKDVKWNLVKAHIRCSRSIYTLNGAC